LDAEEVDYNDPFAASEVSLEKTSLEGSESIVDLAPATVTDLSPIIADPTPLPDPLPDPIPVPTPIPVPDPGLIPTPSDGKDCAVYAIRLTWGHFAFGQGVNSAQDEVAVSDITRDRLLTDWSGSVHVDRGGLVVKKTIAFEKEQDYIVDRTDRKTVAFVSKTSHHFDGLALKYRVCRPDVTILPTDPNTMVDTRATSTDMIATAPALMPILMFESPNVPFKAGYSLEELASLNETIAVGDGNHFRIQSHLIRRVDDEPRYCKGLMHGRGHGFPDREGGVFKGIAVTGGDHLRVGHVVGTYGVHDGQPVFVGKFISHKGGFIGILKGTYGEGKLKGEIFNKDRKVIGSLAGRYGTKEGMAFWGAEFELRCTIHAIDTIDSGKEVDLPVAVEPAPVAE